MFNNPAGRLHHLITEGKRQSGDQLAFQGWAKILKVDESDKATLLTKIGHAVSLPQQIVNRVKLLDDADHKLLLKWMPKVEGAFGQMNFQAKWSEFIGKFDEATLYGIEVCSDQLARRLPENTLDEKQLEEITNLVSNLINEINNSTIDVDIKEYMLAHLAMISNALNEYKIRGLEPIEWSLHATIGSIAIKKCFYKKCNESNLGKKFWTIIGRIALTLSIASSILHIEGETINLLPSQEEYQQNETTESKTSGLDADGEKHGSKGIEG